MFDLIPSNYMRESDSGVPKDMDDIEMLIS